MSPPPVAHVRRARDLIDRCYAEPLDLEAMAIAAGYSRFHFARAFRTAYVAPRSPSSAGAGSSSCSRPPNARTASRPCSGTTPATGSA
ncbi:helix-turn-helix transcriptional regulator [Pseudonocardia oroxyli]|uniref:helix-turn-helix transcriptional regulator n=1 Tax=Pseudonocardia oroxyli TaxID=366584 RepID=UPI0015A0B288